MWLVIKKKLTMHYDTDTLITVISPRDIYRDT
jgi:hypothetical protein